MYEYRYKEKEELNMTLCAIQDSFGEFIKSYSFVLQNVVTLSFPCPEFKVLEVLPG